MAYAASSLIDMVPNEAEILAVLGDKEDAVAVIAEIENSPNPYLFYYSSSPGLTITLKGVTALELALTVGDRWLKTEDLDKIDEDNMALIVGTLATLQAGFSVPAQDQDGVVEEAD